MSSKIECTAVNALIDLVQKKPMDRDSAAELLFAPPAGTSGRRPANGTPGLFAGDVPAATDVAKATAVPAATDQRSDPGARHAANVAKAAQPRNIAAELATKPTEPRAALPKRAAGTPPFEAAPAASIPAFDQATGRKPRQTVQDDLETTYIPRAASTELPRFLKKLVIPAGILVMVGIGVGAAVSISHRDEGKPFDYIAATTLPKVLPTVMVPPPKMAAPPVPVKAMLVAVRIDSTPTGASATLLDRDTGNSMPLGSTPLEASLDPAKSYDVRFELDGRPTTTEHLTLAASDAHPTLSVAFAAADPAPAPVPATTGKKKHHHHERVNSAAAKRVSAAPRSVAAAAKTPASRGEAAPASRGEAALASLGPAKDKRTEPPGALSVSASIRCAILVDGVDTGMVTPAKLTVAAGHHSVRLIAATQHINKQVGVDVIAKKTTRLDQTF
jgi:hypothetical protein